ncbi:MAG: 2-oxoacid:acceptor oxidoreductase subunit alpha [Phycisphaerales bacterium]|nr:2-oxoacid:acceptor oxidoreductase subunit alpha [Phycisphaerales bacterium]
MASDQLIEKPISTLETVVIRFCGDSGDGMQLTGGQFAETSALFGNDFATFPDFPAEIRAPKGTTFGVSGFQLQFSSSDIYTPGDRVNAIVAMNPAGLKVNLPDVEPGGIVIVNEDEFTKVNLSKCGYPDGYNPLEDDQIASTYNLVKVPMSRMTKESLADSGMGAKDINKCRNMFALGIVYWLYERPVDATKSYLIQKFEKKKGLPKIAEINIRALEAGYYFGETTELFASRYRVPPAKQEPGTYRQISGNEATVLGLVTAAQKAQKPLTYASYPITPASNVLHGLSNLKRFGIKTIQSEDEIAAICTAIGASFAGDIGVTGTSGPGLALKGEALGLAMMLELPLVVVDVQRSGPATGMPTKTEQADLLQAMFGRHCESPVIVVAPRSPAECFNIAIEAVRLSIKYMCPVIYLSDGYIANGAEPWKVPDVSSIPAIEIAHPTMADIPDGGFKPYERNSETLARQWAIPGTEGLEHRVGSLEKEAESGNVSYDPDNHDAMVRVRAEKVARAAESIPPLEVNGETSGETLILGWGGTYGSITTAVRELRNAGHQVSSAHLQYLNPFPSNTEEVLRSFKRVIIPEINLGQLSLLIRSKFLINTIGINIVKGQPFKVETLVEEIKEAMNS